MARLQLDAVQLLGEPDVGRLLFTGGDVYGGSDVVVDFETDPPAHASLFG